MIRRQCIVAAVLSAIVFPLAAEASSQLPERQGFVFGIGIGVAAQRFDAENVEDGQTKGFGNSFALPAQLQIGYSVAPRVAVLLGAYASGTGETVSYYRVGSQFETRIFAVLGPAAQVQVFGPVWARAGAGYAMLSDTRLDKANRNGFGLTLAAGLPLARGRTVTLDVEARYLYGKFSKAEEWWNGDQRDTRRTAKSYGLVFSVNTW